MWLLMSSLLPIHTIKGQRTDEGRATENVPVDVIIRVDLQPDGTVLYQGQELPIEQLVPQLRRQIPIKPLHVTVHADAETPTMFVITVIEHLNEQGVKFSLQTGR